MIERLERRTLLAGYPYALWNFPSDYGDVSGLCARTGDAVWAALDPHTSPVEPSNVNNHDFVRDGPSRLVRIAPDGALTSTITFDANTFITALASGPDGKLRFGALQGPTNLQTGGTLQYIGADGKVATVKSGLGRIDAMAVTPDDRVWFDAYGLGIERYDLVTGHTDGFATDPPIAPTVLAASSKGDVFVAGTGPYHNTWREWAGGLDGQTGAPLGASPIDGFLIRGVTELDGARYAVSDTWGTASVVRTVSIGGGSGELGDTFQGHENRLPGIGARASRSPYFTDIAAGPDGYLYLADEVYGIVAVDPSKAYVYSYPDNTSSYLDDPDATFVVDWPNQFGNLLVEAGPDGNIDFAQKGRWNWDDAKQTKYYIPGAYGRIAVEQTSVSVGADVAHPLNPGDVVTFTLDTTAGPDQPDKVTLTDLIPAGMRLVAGSLTTTGTIVHDGSDGQFQIEATGTDRVHLQFQARVGSIDDLPLGAESLVNQAKVDARYPDGRTVHGRTDYPVPLAQTDQIQVTIVPITPVPGVFRPGDTIEYKLSAKAAPGTTHTEITMMAPPGTTLYYNDQKVDSVSFGSDSNSVDNSFNIFGPRKVTAVVNSLAKLPVGQDAIVATLHAQATLRSGLVAAKDATSRLLIAGMRIAVTPLNTQGPVTPGQTIPYEAKVDVPTQASTLTITIPPPLGTTAYGGRQLTYQVANASSGTFHFSLVVCKASDLRTLSIDCTANAQATFVDGSTLTGKDTNTLKVADPLDANVSASVAAANPSDKFSYAIRATSTVPATRFTVEDQVPAGLVVVPSSVTDGGVILRTSWHHAGLLVAPRGHFGQTRFYRQGTRRRPHPTRPPERDQPGHGLGHDLRPGGRARGALPNGDQPGARRQRVGVRRDLPIPGAEHPASRPSGESEGPIASKRARRANDDHRRRRLVPLLRQEARDLHNSHVCAGEGLRGEGRCDQAVALRSQGFLRQDRSGTGCASHLGRHLHPCEHPVLRRAGHA